MANLNKTQIQQLITDLDIKENEADSFFQGLANKGHILEGYNDQPKAPTLTEKVKSGLSNVIAETKTDLAKRKENLLSRQGEAEAKIQTEAQKSTAGEQSMVEGALKSAKAGAEAGLRGLGDVAGGVGDVVGNVIGAGLKGVNELTGGKLSEAGKAILQTEGGQAGLQALQGGMEKYKLWATENPESAKNLEAVVNVASLIPTAKGGQLAGKGAVKGANFVVNTVEEAIPGVVDAAQTGINTIAKAGDKVVDVAKTGTGKVKNAVLGNQDQAITEILSPELTKVARRAAIQEGRVIEGRKIPLIGKFADQIEPEKAIKDLTKLVQEDLKVTKKTSPFELRTKMDTEIGKIAQNIKPELEKIQIGNDTLNKLKTEIGDIFKKQAEDPEFFAFAGAKKAQSNFKNIVDKINENSSKNDVWEAIKKYDNIVSKNVKEATEGVSAPSTLLQKDMWLENRRVLRSLLDDATPLGDKTDEAFRKMRLYYEGLNNIDSKAMIDTKGGIDIANWVKKEGWKYAVGATGVAGIGTILK